LAVVITGPLIAGGALVLNQYFDVELDRRADRNHRYMLVTEEFKTATALGYAVFLLVMGVLVAVFVNLDVLVLSLMAVVLSVGYSGPPVRLKSRPIVDSLTNGVSYGILPTLVGASLVPDSLLRGLLISLPLLVGYTAGHMLLAIPDIQNDSRFGLHSTAVVLGRERTVNLATSLFALMFVILVGYVYTAFVSPFVGIFVFPVGALVLWELASLVRRGESVRATVYQHLSIEFLVLAVVFLVGLCLSGRWG
jgi:geranylgeranylglycerol-phosphate geranylgeranyltransferase